MGTPQVLSACAQASQAEGVRLLRLEGSESIAAIRQATGLPCIGLIKRQYPGSDVYITPTESEVNALIALGCEVIALDATLRLRPNGAQIAELIQVIRDAGRAVMADCDSIESAHAALKAGVDIVSTTLAGYTGGPVTATGPDFELLRALVAAAKPYGAVVLAEGRYAEPFHLTSALAMGADGVVIGGALNDPVKQTRRFVNAAGLRQETVGAVDIGGTWLRFGLFSVANGLEHIERIPLPADRGARLDWIESMARENGVRRLGISTGGVVDPKTNTVIEAKAIIPDHVGSQFVWEGLDVVALNDGLATAWGHAMHPSFAGRNVATLALGTGVGCGCVSENGHMLTQKGNYPRLNDLEFGTQSFEELLGGAALTPNPGPGAKEAAQRALDAAAAMIRALWMPDDIVLCGGVGLAAWIRTPPGSVASPYGHEAGLVGAGWLAIQPPVLS